MCWHIGDALRHETTGDLIFSHAEPKSRSFELRLAIQLSLSPSQTRQYASNLTGRGSEVTACRSRRRQAFRSRTHRQAALPKSLLLATT